MARTISSVNGILSWIIEANGAESFAYIHKALEDILIFTIKFDQTRAGIVEHHLKVVGLFEQLVRNKLCN